MGSWWDRGVNLLTLAAMLVTAWATWRTWEGQRRQYAAAKPTVSMPHGGIIFRAPNSKPAVLTFSLDMEHRAVWRIERVLVRWPFWVRPLSPFVNPAQDPQTGEMVYSPTAPCQRSVWFEDGVNESHLFVSASTGKSLLLRFVIVMRASPSITSRFDARISIKD